MIPRLLGFKQSLFMEIEYNNARDLNKAMLENQRDLQPAVDIGSNRRLVNTFLPLLEGKF